MVQSQNYARFLCFVEISLGVVPVNAFLSAYLPELMLWVSQVDK